MPSCAAAAPGGEHGGDARPVAIPPVATSGRSTAARHERQQREQPEVAGRPVVERAAMAARLDALDDERVGARVAASRASAGVVTVTHIALPASCSAATTPAGGQPNVNDTTAARSRASSASLASQPSSSWRGEPSAPRRARRRRELRGVALDGGLVGHRRRRREQVDAERPIGQCARGAQVLRDGVDGLVAGSQEPDPPRVADRRGQRRRRRPTGERRPDDRHLQRVQREALSRRHVATASRRA